MVGSDGVAEDGEDARAGDVGDGRGSGRDAVEVGGLADVGGVGLPLVGVAVGEFEALPVGVAEGHGRILAGEPLAGDAESDGRGDFRLGGPDVAQKDWVALLIEA